MKQTIIEAYQSMLNESLSFDQFEQFAKSLGASEIEHQQSSPDDYSQYDFYSAKLSDDISIIFLNDSNKVKLSIRHMEVATIPAKQFLTWTPATVAKIEKADLDWHTQQKQLNDQVDQLTDQLKQTKADLANTNKQFKSSIKHLI